MNEIKTKKQVSNRLFIALVTLTTILFTIGFIIMMLWWEAILWIVFFILFTCIIYFLIALKQTKEKIYAVMIILSLISLVFLYVCIIPIIPYTIDVGSRVDGSLIYLENESTNQSAVFEVIITTPNNPAISDISYTILNDMDNPVILGGANITISHIVSDNSHLKTSDHITLEVDGVSDLKDYEIILTINGIVKGKTPS